MPWGNFLKFGTKVHLDLRMNRWHFGGQRSRSPLISHPSHYHERDIPGTTQMSTWIQGWTDLLDWLAVILFFSINLLFFYTLLLPLFLWLLARNCRSLLQANPPSLRCWRLFWRNAVRKVWFTKWLLCAVLETCFTAARRTASATWLRSFSLWSRRLNHIHSFDITCFLLKYCIWRHCCILTVLNLSSWFPTELPRERWGITEVTGGWWW